MKRIINFRPSVLVALLFGGGILSGYAHMRGLYWVCVVVISIILVACLVFILIKKQKVWLMLLVLALSCISGFFTYQRAYIHNINGRIGSQEVILEGCITDSSDIDSHYLILRNCTITLEDQSTKKLNAKVRLLIFGQEEGNILAVGNRVSTHCVLSDVDIFADAVNTYAYKSNVLYVGEDANDIAVTDGKPKFNERIRAYFKDKLHSFMGDESASVMLGMIIGDTSNMSSEDVDAFRVSGISHLLAVSGLHLGFIVTLFDQLLRKLKVHHGKRFIIVLPPLLFYAYLVGFSPSVMRALIMTTVLMILRAMGGTRDVFTSLFIAGFVILAIKPFYIFDAGFLLSFSAVFGIATLSRLLGHHIRRVGTTGLLVNVLSAISVSLGATVGTLPVVALVYGEVALLGVLVNILVIPLATVSFVIAMITMLPLPLLGYVLWLVDKTVWLLRNIALLVAKLPFASVRAPVVGVECLLVFALLFVVSGYVNIKGKGKTIVSGGVCCLVLLGLVLNSIPLKPTDKLYYLDTYSGDSIVVVTQNAQMHIVSDIASSDDVNSIIEVIKDYDELPYYLYITSFNRTDYESMVTLLSYIEPTRVALLQEEGNGAIESLFENRGIEINYLGFDEAVVNKVWQCGIVGYSVKCGEITLLIAKEVEDNLSRAIFGIDIIITKENATEVDNTYTDSVVMSYYYEQNENILNLSNCGDFTCWAKKGIITIDI